MQFHLELPLTLSVVRVAGRGIRRGLRLPAGLRHAGHPPGARRHRATGEPPAASLGGRQVGLVSAAPGPAASGSTPRRGDGAGGGPGRPGAHLAGWRVDRLAGRAHPGAAQPPVATLALIEGSRAAGRPHRGRHAGCRSSMWSAQGPPSGSAAAGRRDRPHPPWQYRGGAGPRRRVLVVDRSAYGARA
ncbi:hypothetical protein ACU4GD_26820 [Cupriavidus basilensis]